MWHNMIGDKMYIETRTTHTEVIADVLRELEYKVNSVTNSVIAFNRHPSMNTKPALRAEANELMGAYALTMKVVGGYDLMPKALVDKVMQARDAAVQVVTKLN